MDIDERGEQIPQNYEEEEEEPEGEVGEEPDVDNDCDEEVEGSGTFGEKSRRGRSVTLQMLMADGTLQHGEGVMCVEYLVRTRLIVEHSPKV